MRIVSVDRCRFLEMWDQLKRIHRHHMATELTHPWVALHSQQDRVPGHHPMGHLLATKAAIFIPVDLDPILATRCPLIHHLPTVLVLTFLASPAASRLMELDPAIMNHIRICQDQEVVLNFRRDLADFLEKPTSLIDLLHIPLLHLYRSLKCPRFQIPMTTLRLIHLIITMRLRLIHLRLLEEARVFQVVLIRLCRRVSCAIFELTHVVLRFHF